MRYGKLIAMSGGPIAHPTSVWITSVVHRCACLTRGAISALEVLVVRTSRRRSLLRVTNLWWAALHAYSESPQT